jgi:hypothetical protein
VGPCPVAHLLGAPQVIFVAAVGKIHPDHVYTGLNHVIQHLGIIGRRTQGGDNLGSSLHNQALLSIKNGHGICGPG